MTRPHPDTTNNQAGRSVDRDANDSRLQQQNYRYSLPQITVRSLTNHRQQYMYIGEIIPSDPF